MKIAVVTPVFQSNRSWLEKCLASVRQQTIRCTHFLINDGDPSLIGCNWPGVDFFHLPQTHANEGFTAMAIGALSAVAQNYDAVAFLGADHWFETTHLQQLVEMHKAKGAAVCTAGRKLVDGEGRLLGKCFEVDGDKYVDANAILLTKEAFGLLSAWQHIPRSLALIGDRIIWKAIRDANICRSHNHSPTVNFRTAFASHFTYFKKKPIAPGTQQFLSSSLEQRHILSWADAH
jgi:Glycosyl transferase family 2